MEGHDGPGAEDTNIRVAVRCRPLSNKETNNGESSCVRITDSTITLTGPNPNDGEHSFAFDLLFGQNSLQSEVWEAVGLPVLEKAIAGYNGTVFAYGQTGSGKTWSMQGLADNDDLQGIIPRMCQMLFVKIAGETARQSTIKFLVTASYFEIYNEVLFDLLDASDRKKRASKVDKAGGGGLEIKEHPALGVYVKGLQEMVVDHSDKLLAIVEQGMKNRTVASTQMNADSSRSHSVFTITVHQKDSTDESRNIFAKINLVDLAGSERVKSTGATGATLKEGANINKSLSALGNVINALVEAGKAGKGNTFIPYRNSKLTRVLQESLGGNSLTTMLAALSPAACNFDETLSTLKYANRAKAIKVKAVKNEEASQISRLNDEIRLLREKLLLQEANSLTDRNNNSSNAQEREQAKLAELERAAQSTWEAKAQLSQAHELERQRLLQEQRLAATQLRLNKQRQWQLLEEKMSVELTLIHIRDILLASTSSNASSSNATGAASGALELVTTEVLERLLKQLHVVEAQDKLQQDQQAVCTVFRNALDKDLNVNGLLHNLRCDAPEAHATVLSVIQQLQSKAQALLEEVQRWIPLAETTQSMYIQLRNHVRKLCLHHYSLCSPATFPRSASSTASSVPESSGTGDGEEVDEEVQRGLQLLCAQVQQRLRSTSKTLLQQSALQADLSSVLKHVQTFVQDHYASAVKRDCVLWSSSPSDSSSSTVSGASGGGVEEVLRLLTQTVQSLDRLGSELAQQGGVAKESGGRGEDKEVSEEVLPFVLYQHPSEGSSVSSSSHFVVNRESAGSQGHLLSAGTLPCLSVTSRRPLSLTSSSSSAPSERCVLLQLVGECDVSMIRALRLSAAQVPIRASAQTRSDVQGGADAEEDEEDNELSVDGMDLPGATRSDRKEEREEEQWEENLRTHLQALATHIQTLNNNPASADVDIDTIAKETALMFGQLIDWQTLLKHHEASRFLKRPPVRFLFDLLVHLCDHYLCCCSSATPEEVAPKDGEALLRQGDWSLVGVSRESKTSYLDQTLLAVQHEVTVLHSLDPYFASAEVREEVCRWLLSKPSSSAMVAGQQSEHSNLLLQLLALCIMRRHALHTQKQGTRSQQSDVDKAHQKTKNASLKSKKTLKKHGTSSSASSIVTTEVTTASVYVSVDGLQWDPLPCSTSSNSPSLVLTLEHDDALASSEKQQYKYISVSIDSFVCRANAHAALDHPAAEHVALSIALIASVHDDAYTASAHLQLPRTRWHLLATTSLHLLHLLARACTDREVQERRDRIERDKQKNEYLQAQQLQRAQALVVEKDALQSSNEELAQQLQLQVQQLLEAQRTISDLRNQIQALEDTNHKLAQQEQAHAQEIAQLQTQALLKDAALDKEVHKVAVLQEMCDNMREAQESAQSELSYAHKRCEEIESERDELQQALVVAQEERDAAREREEDLHERLCEAQQDLERLQESYVDIADRCHDAQDENLELKDQIEHLQDSLRLLSSSQNNHRSAAPPPNSSSSSSNSHSNNSHSNNSHSTSKPAAAARTQAAAEEEARWDADSQAKSSSSASVGAQQKKAAKRTSSGGGGAQQQHVLESSDDLSMKNVHVGHQQAPGKSVSKAVESYDEDYQDDYQDDFQDE